MREEGDVWQLFRFSQVCVTDWMLMAFTEIQEKCLRKSDASPSLLPLHATFTVSLPASAPESQSVHFTPRFYVFFPLESPSQLLPVYILLTTLSQSRYLKHSCILASFLNLPVSFLLCKFTHHSQTLFFQLREEYY